MRYHTPRLTRLFSHSEMPRCGEEKVAKRLNCGQYSFRWAKAERAISPPSENPMKLISEKWKRLLSMYFLTSYATCTPKLYIDWLMSLVMD